MNKTIIVATLLFACNTVFADQDMQQRIDALQEELDALKSQVENGMTAI